MAVNFSKLSGKTDSLYKAVEGVLTEVISDEEKELSKHEEVLNAVFDVRKSNKFGERAGGYTSFGNMKPLAEGGKITNDEIEEGYAKLVVHTPFGNGFVTTHEMAEDGEIDIAKTAAMDFVSSYKRSKLDFGTKFLASEGTTFTYEGVTFDRTTGDNKGFFATDHPQKRNASATQSNIYTNAFGTDDAMLNRLSVIGRGFKNDSGHAIGATYDTILIPGNCANLEKTIKAIIASNQIVGSANNDINIQKGKWNLVVDHLWEAASGTEPYIIFSSELKKKLGALRFYNRETLDVRSWIDESTRNLCWSGYDRHSILPYMWQGYIMGGASVGTTLT